MTSADMAAAAAVAAVPASHPFLIAAADPEIDSALEDAAQSGFAGTGKLLQSKGSRKLSASDFAKAKAKAELTGQDGEGLINGYLTARAAAGEILWFKWASCENAVAPYDFDVFATADGHTLIDVKATAGPFENMLHISLAEIIEAAGSDAYKIYRVFELSEDGGELCVSDDIRSFAQQLKVIHETYMPAGVRVDGFSVATSTLTWGPRERVERPEE